MTNFFTNIKKNVQKNAEIVSRLLGRNLKNNETRAKSTHDIRDTGTKAGQKNEITALVDGDFGDSRGQPASESGFVIPVVIVANGVSVSSTSNSLVDNLKPAEGI